MPVVEAPVMMSITGVSSMHQPKCRFVSAALSTCKTASSSNSL
jgi:hypothetical protein